MVEEELYPVAIVSHQELLPFEEHPHCPYVELEHS
jgi:hypothetical protein